MRLVQERECENKSENKNKMAGLDWTGQKWQGWQKQERVMCSGTNYLQQGMRSVLVGVELRLDFTKVCMYIMSGLDM